MLRSKYISFLLFFAFTVMQAHIALPHHHHDVPEKTSDHSLSHKHDHNHNQEKKHSGSDALGDLIGHEAHANTPAEIFHTSVADHAVKKADFKIPFLAKTEYLFKYPKVPDSPKFPSSGFGFYKSGHSHSFQLRGPPAFVL